MVEAIFPAATKKRPNLLDLQELGIIKMCNLSTIGEPTFRWVEFNTGKRI